MAVQVSQPYDESYAYKMDLVVISRLLCMGMLRCHDEMLTLMHVICLTTATQETFREQSQTFTLRVTAVYSIYEQAANDVTYRGYNVSMFGPSGSAAESLLTWIWEIADTGPHTPNNNSIML